MSIRVGLYDFFAYTLPGIFYLGIIVFWLNTVNLFAIDFAVLKDSWGAVAFLVFALGYISGLLIDPLAYGWIRRFHRRNSEAARVAFDEFRERHSWVQLNYEARDWGILLRAIKSVSVEAAADVEQHNVAFIMHRNISLAFVFCSISSIIYYFAVLSNLLILVLGLALFVLALLAMRRGIIRRHWFYMAVFEAFTAHFLLDHKAGNQKMAEGSGISSPKSSRRRAIEKR